MTVSQTILLLNSTMSYFNLRKMKTSPKPFLDYGSSSSTYGLTDHQHCQNALLND